MRLLALFILILTPTLLVPSLGFAGVKEDLFQLINKRLSYAQDVATYKFHNHKDISDLAREKDVLDASSILAEQYGLEASLLKLFIQAQMNANKAIQYRNFANWMSTPAPAQKISLNDIRGKLNTLNTQIMLNIIEVLKTSPIQQKDYKTFSKILNVENLDDNDKQELFKSLKGLKLIEK